MESAFIGLKSARQKNFIEDSVGGNVKAASVWQELLICLMGVGEGLSACWNQPGVVHVKDEDVYLVKPWLKLCHVRLGDKLCVVQERPNVNPMIVMVFSLDTICDGYTVLYPTVMSKALYDCEQFHAVLFTGLVG